MNTCKIISFTWSLSEVWALFIDASIFKWNFKWTFFFKQKYSWNLQSLKQSLLDLENKHVKYHIQLDTMFVIILNAERPQENNLFLNLMHHAPNL